MTVREYTLGVAEKTRVFYGDPSDDLSKVVKKVYKWVKRAEEEGRYPYEVHIRSDEDSFSAMVRYTEV